LRNPNTVDGNLSREDLMDMIDRVDPSVTPCYSMAKREMELGNTLFSWEVDSWLNPQGAYGPGDGYPVQIGTETPGATGASDETADVSANMRKMGNIGQAFRRVYGAGWIANSVPTLPEIGKRKLLARGAANAMVLQKQDIECAFTSFDQTAVQDVGGASGSIMAGVRKLIDQANQYTAATAFSYGQPTDIQYAPTGACYSGTGTMANTFNLTLLRNAALALRQSVKRNRDYMFLVGLSLRMQITALIDPQTASVGAGGMAATQVRMFSQALSDSTLGISIDVIRTDYGRFLVVPTDFIGYTTENSSGVVTGTRSSRVYTNVPSFGMFLATERLFKRIGVAPEKNDLFNDGGGTRQQVRTYQAVGVLNPQAFGFLAFPS